MLKQLYFKFQHINYNIAQFAGEYEKFGRFVNNYLALITFLTVRDINIPTWVILISYPVLMTLANYGGRALIALGVVKYNNTIGNAQNKELMEILKKQDEIIKLLKK